MTPRSVVDRDISGVPLFELVNVYDKYGTCNVLTMSKRTGINEPTLRAFLVKQEATFVGLGIADPTITAFGQNICSLEWAGEIHIVPAARGSDRGSHSARLMLEDEMWATDTQYSETMLAWRISELILLRQILCVHPESHEHQDALRCDAELSKKRRERERGLRRKRPLRRSATQASPLA